LLPGLACDEFIAALPSLGVKDRIPRFEEINERLRGPPAGKSWRAGADPRSALLHLLANRKFPVTDWIRTPQEFDYIVEPDIFHDLFGHVPLLFNPVFADYVQRYGQGGLKANDLGACELLSRLYWYTIEFGLIRQPTACAPMARASSVRLANCSYAVQSPEPNRCRWAGTHHAHPLQDRQLPADLLCH
jgi:phenylalanine-4-hydroxylase